MNTRFYTTLALAILSVAGVTQGGLVGTFDVATSNGYNESMALTGLPLPDGTYLWSGQITQNDFTTSGTFIGSPDAPGIASVVQVVNGSDDAMAFTIDFTMPLTNPVAENLAWESSVYASLAGSDVSLSALIADSIWHVDVAGEDTAALMPYPFELVVDGHGANTAYDEGSGLVSWADGEDLSIRLSFELSPGATVMFNGGFTTIPAPAGLAIVSSMLWMRRKRRH